MVSRTDYYNLSERLRVKGFKEDMSEAAPICRWLIDGVMLDVMPVDTKILGFGNEWYSPAAENAEMVKLQSSEFTKMVSAPYFIMTKLEAFNGRGNGDFLMNHDIEDIIAVIDGRAELLVEIRLSDAAQVSELRNRFKKLLNNNRFIDAVSGHMPTDDTSQARAEIVIKVINDIAAM